MIRSSLLVGLCLTFIGGLPAAGAVTQVPIQIDEPTNHRSVPWPVTTGVPFPRGGLRSMENCRLVDDLGQVVPLQTKAAATWDQQCSSIRWLTIDFIARPGRAYTLEFGDEVQAAQPEKLLQIQEGEPLRVSTRAMTVDFSAVGKSALGAIRIDLNGDGKIAEDETAASGHPQGEHDYVNQDGARFSSSGDGQDREIAVERNGPVRACIRVDGYYTGPGGERIVAHRTRYHLFAGLRLIKVVHEFKVQGSTAGVQFRDIGFTLHLPLGGQDRVVAADVSGEPGNQVRKTSWQPDTVSVSSYQSTYRHLGNPEYEAGLVAVNSQGATRLAQSDRCGEWMQVADTRAAVTGSLRWFWQQFPKEWETTSDSLRLHLWSSRGGPLDFSSDGIRKFFGPIGGEYLLDYGHRGTPNPISNFFYYAGHQALERGEADGRGVNKHHEFYLHFAPEGQEKAGQEFAALAAKQPLALASGEWNCGTDVFGPLMPRPNDSPYEAIVDGVFDLGREAQDEFGDYGWWWFGSGPHYSYQWDKDRQRHYADPRRFEYHTYQKETQLWWNYLRSGERKFHDWAFPSENHWVDVAVSHQPLEYHCDWRGGFKHPQTLILRPGEWAIDSPLHYIRQRDSAEAWLRGGSQFWGSYHRTLETTTLAYYLSDDERYNDVINYWREYWAPLASKTSASSDIPRWHQQQPWFAATKPGEPERSWAVMMRDYAPFRSGSRHQQTFFFNMATLYEHTWDPQIKEVLSDCADAYIDVDSPIGTWLTQENRLPAFAEAPKLAHYWVPAMWKYARASGDPQMDEVFRKYFAACWATDPFLEEVGVYSDVQIAYAYYLTRDPRHLRPAVEELDSLLPNSEPLARPEDLNRRLYNPYAVIHSLAGVPRLIWAVEEARRQGVKIPPPAPMKPQRTAIALLKQKGKPLSATLWGYDRELRVLTPDGKPLGDLRPKSTQHASEKQPFDRNLPEFAVYLHELTIPAAAPQGFYVLAPELELGVVSQQGAATVLANAAVPVQLQPGESFNLCSGALAGQGSIETGRPADVVVLDRKENVQMTSTEGGLLKLATPSGDAMSVKNRGTRALWFRIVHQDPARCWISRSPSSVEAVPSPELTAASVEVPAAVNEDAVFVDGRFGKAIRIAGKRQLHIPDHMERGGKQVKLFDLRQGTLECWVRRHRDDRLLTRSPRATFLTNGVLRCWPTDPMPLNEWSHVAVCWRPFNRDPEQLCVHVYIDGLDKANYRSTWWAGYGDRPASFPNGKWLEEFIARAVDGGAFDIDEIRLSSTARYTDPDVRFGGQQTFNPYRFQPPQEPFTWDEHTLLHLQLDGNLTGQAAGGEKIQAKLTP